MIVNTAKERKPNPEGNPMSTPKLALTPQEMGGVIDRLLRGGMTTSEIAEKTGFSAAEITSLHAGAEVQPATPISEARGSETSGEKTVLGVRTRPMMGLQRRLTA